MSSNSPAEQLGEYARNALYVTIGLGVLAVQQVQVQRRQLGGWVNGQAADARTSLDGLQDKLQDRVKLAEERLGALEEQVETILADLTGRLPGPVKDVAGQSIDYAAQARSELRDLIAARIPARPGRPTKAA